MRAWRAVGLVVGVTVVSGVMLAFGVMAWASLGAPGHQWIGWP